jgi:hypothetical protein
MRDILSWDSIHRLHKIRGHLMAAANEIEEFGVNIIDAGEVSEALKEFSGISLWQLRNICDFMTLLWHRENDRAKKFEEYLNGKAERHELDKPLDWCI